MSDVIFDYARGAVAEKALDSAARFAVVLIKTAEADATLKTRATLTEVLAHSTEADFTNYARKTGLTGTVVTDVSTHVRKASIPDQTWGSAGASAGNTLAKLLVCYVEAGSVDDSTIIPLVALDWVVSTDGNDLGTVFNAIGFWQSA